MFISKNIPSVIPLPSICDDSGTLGINKTFHSSDGPTTTQYMFLFTMSTRCLRFAFFATFAAAVILAACKKDGPSLVKVSAPGPIPFKGEVYRTVDDQSGITLTSPDELEIRENGMNLICKYTKQDQTLRVVLTAMGSSQALYFKQTAEGLIGPNNVLFLNSATFEKAHDNKQRADALLAACAQGNAARITELCANGASIKLWSSNGETPLGLAIRSNNPSAVTAVLDAGANPNQQYTNQMFPLMDALSRLNTDSNAQAVATILIRRGARVDIHDENGQTPLGVVCFYNPVKMQELIELLLIKNADPNGLKDRGKPPITGLYYPIINVDEAQDKQIIDLRLTLIELLLKKGADPRVIFNEVAQMEGPRFQKILRMLIKCGANPDMRDHDGRTQLMFALYYGHSEAAKVLLEEGADKNARDNHGQDVKSYSHDPAFVSKMLATAFKPIIHPILPIAIKDGKPQTLSEDAVRAASLDLWKAARIANACKLYAIDNSGQFPTELRNLIPTYLGNIADLSSPLATSPNGIDYEYMGSGLLNTESKNVIFLRSRYTGADGERAVVRLNGENTFFRKDGHWISVPVGSETFFNQNVGDLKMANLLSFGREPGIPHEAALRGATPVSINDKRGERVNEDLERAKEIASACQFFALDNAGHYPNELTDLVPDYLANRTMLESPLASQHSGVDYEYFGSGLVDTDSRDIVFIRSRYPHPDGTRTVVRLNSRAVSSDNGRKSVSFLPDGKLTNRFLFGKQ